MIVMHWYSFKLNNSTNNLENKRDLQAWQCSCSYMDTSICHVLGTNIKLAQRGTILYT